MAEITEQIVREAPEIEAYKIGLMQAAKNLTAPTLPSYQVAGLSQDQRNAMQAGVSGIGAYLPYMTSGTGGLTAGASALGEAANVLRGADTRGQFTAAQQAYNMSGTPIAGMGQAAASAITGLPYITQGARSMDIGQQLASQRATAQLAPAESLMMRSLQEAQYGTPQFAEALAATRRGEAQPTFAAGTSALTQGMGALSGAAGAYAPGSAAAFMNPYQQQVIDESIRQIDRQGNLAQQAQQAQAVRAGAFGGSREGVQRAELGRALAEQRNAAIVGGLSQGYGQAAQQAQLAFEQQQQRQLAQSQGYGQLAGQAGQLGTQQGSLSMQAAQQFGSLEAQRAQQALQQAQYTGNIGQQLGSQQMQQAQLGQQAAGIMGNIGQQQAALAGQQAGIAGQQASILGQQGQLQQQLGAGIGSLAGQQFGIGQQMAQGIGSLGTQMGNIGAQQGAMGQLQQQLGQQDVNFLYGLGAQQQRQTQAELDAQRATTMQSAMQPYQQIAFQSDIYKGAPSTQMAVTTQQTPTPSPFQQIAGLATGVLGTAGAMKTAGVM